MCGGFPGAVESVNLLSTVFLRRHVRVGEGLGVVGGERETGDDRASSPLLTFLWAWRCGFEGGNRRGMGFWRFALVSVRTLSRDPGVLAAERDALEVSWYRFGCEIDDARRNVDAEQTDKFSKIATKPDDRFDKIDVERLRSRYRSEAVCLSCI